MTVNDLPTPALLLDIDLFEANISAMATHAASAGKNLRPHAKAHKCVEIARRQIAAGAVGVSCATVDEVELMASSGIPGVLLTSPIADPAKAARIAALSAQPGTIMAVVDHQTQVSMYDLAAQNAGTKLHLLIDLDVGDHRTGISPGREARELASSILNSGNLRFRGLQAYSVRASHLREDEGRAQFSAGALACVVETIAQVESLGVKIEIVSGGSTGTALDDTALPYMTELQAGSYGLMDVAYRRVGGLPFQNAMRVLATVVSANQQDRVTVDAGFKAFSTDRPFGPEILDGNGMRYEWAGDEFGFVYFDSSAARRSLGQRLFFIPPHCDPTVNLYDRIYAVRGAEVIDTWPVMNRWRN